MGKLNNTVIGNIYNVIRFFREKKVEALYGLNHYYKDRFNIYFKFIESLIILRCFFFQADFRALLNSYGTGNVRENEEVQTIF